MDLTGKKHYTSTEGEKKVYEGKYIPMAECITEARIRDLGFVADALEELSSRGWAGIIVPGNGGIADAIGAIVWWIEYTESEYRSPEETADAIEKIDATDALILMPEQ